LREKPAAEPATDRSARHLSDGGGKKETNWYAVSSRRRKGSANRTSTLLEKGGESRSPGKFLGGGGKGNASSKASLLRKKGELIKGRELRALRQESQFFC